MKRRYPLLSRQHGLLRIFLSYFESAPPAVSAGHALRACSSRAVDLTFPLVSRRAINTHAARSTPTRTFFVDHGHHGRGLSRCAAFFYYIIAYWGHTFGIRVEADIRRDLFRHMQSARL